MSSASCVGHGLLVGPVGGGERVVDVGDGHHLRLHGDGLAGDGARVAGAVELLVVGVGDLRHAAQGARPGDLREEAVGVRDVALDLLALLGGQRAAGDGERADLVARAAAAGAARCASRKVSLRSSLRRSKPPCASTVGRLQVRTNSNTSSSCLSSLCEPGVLLGVDLGHGLVAAHLHARRAGAGSSAAAGPCARSGSASAASSSSWG